MIMMTLNGNVLWPEFGINCDIVVGEFTHLGVINTDDFRILISAEAKTRDEVHDPEDDGGHDQRITETSCGISNLVTKLDPVVINPSSGNVGNTVKSGNARLSKEGSENVSNHSTNTVSSKDLQRRDE
jgi:hypothetical protein